MFTASTYLVTRRLWRYLGQKWSDFHSAKSHWKVKMPPMEWRRPQRPCLSAWRPYWTIYGTFLSQFAIVYQLRSQVFLQKAGCRGLINTYGHLCPCFFSPPVHIARWADVHCFLSVRPSVTLLKIHISESIIGRSLKLYHSMKNLLMYLGKISITLWKIYFYHNNVGHVLAQVESSILSTNGSGVYSSSTPFWKVLSIGFHS